MDAVEKKEFKYDKIVGKLKDFPNLSEKKRIKVLKRILTDEAALRWQFDPDQDRNFNADQIFKLYELMASPSVIKCFGHLLDEYDKKDFSRSSVNCLNMVLNVALKNNEKMIADVKDSYSFGGSVEAKDLELKTKKYVEWIDELKDLIRKLSKKPLEKIAADTNLPQNLIFQAMTSIPEARFIQNPRVSHFTMAVLGEIYEEASNEDRWRSGVRWKPLFVELFGVEQIPSVAVSILLEGKHRIDAYHDNKNLRTVMDCWDSLTKFALDTLDRSPENIRKQMVELYLKKANKLILRRQGRPTDIRINMERLPNDFSNLIRTISFYREGFDSMMSKLRFGDDSNRVVRNINQKVGDTSSGIGKIIDGVSEVASNIANAIDTGDDDDED